MNPLSSRQAIYCTTMVAWLTVGQIVYGADVTGSAVHAGAAGLERGIARVICAKADSSYSVRSRALIVDTGESTPAVEVMLAPAHVLPRDPQRIKPDCRIARVVGSAAKIAEFWLPDDRDTAGGDWAVLLTDQAFNSDIGRLRTGVVAQEVLERLLAEGVPMHLVLYQPQADLHGCKLIDASRSGLTQLQHGVFSHSCRTWPGTSGAPLVVGLGGEPVVIGMNIGQSLRPSRFSGPSFYGVGQAIHAEIAATIELAVERARAVTAAR